MAVTYVLIYKIISRWPLYITHRNIHTWSRPDPGWGGLRDTGGQTSQQVVAAYGGTHVVKNTKRPLRQGAHQE